MFLAQSKHTQRERGWLRSSTSAKHVPNKTTAKQSIKSTLIKISQSQDHASRDSGTSASELVEWVSLLKLLVAESRLTHA
jgi:hypothetical protein